MRPLVGSADVIPFPQVNLAEIMTTPDDKAKLAKINPVITTYGLMAAKLITISDDHEELIRGDSPEQAQALRHEIEDLAIKYTGYFAENITCMLLAESFAPREAREACTQLTHGATVACKRVPNLLWNESISNVVAKGFDDVQYMTPSALRDQDAMIDSLMTGLVVTAPNETPEHLGTLAHAMVNWSRKATLEPDASDPRPPASARADAVARIILNRLGRDADAELNPDAQAAA